MKIEKLKERKMRHEGNAGVVGNTYSELYSAYASRFEPAR